MNKRLLQVKIKAMKKDYWHEWMFTNSLVKKGGILSENEKN